MKYFRKDGDGKHEISQETYSEVTNSSICECGGLLTPGCKMGDLLCRGECKCLYSIEMTSDRPSWDDYFSEIAKLVATRSTCMRAQHGAVIVNQEHRILTTGYNGSPPGTFHCVDKGECLRERMQIPSGQRYELCRALHAEHNALLQASKNGISVKGATLYITDIPCELCSKQIHAVGIKEVVILKDSQRYDSRSLHDFKDHGGIVRFLK